MIDFNNAENIDRAAKDFVSSHDLLTLDFSGYRKCQIGDEDDIAKYPAIKELINKDLLPNKLSRVFSYRKIEQCSNNTNLLSS